MGIQASNLDLGCRSEKTEEVNVDAAAGQPTPRARRTRRKSCSHVGESLRNIWIRTINEGKAVPSQVDFVVQTVFAQSEEEGYVEIPFPDGGRAIHYAVLSDNLFLVAYLANSLHCDINATTDRTNDTPLLLAAQTGNLEIVKFLLGFPTSAGELTREDPADVHLCNASGETVVDIAEEDENCDLLRLLSSDNIDRDSEEAEHPTVLADQVPAEKSKDSTTNLLEQDEDDGEDEGEFRSPASSPVVYEPSSSSQDGEVGGVMTDTETMNMEEDSAFTPKEMTGWLQKRRYKENRKLHLGKSTWSDRFVVLRDGWLCWGPNEVEVAALDQPMKHSVFNQAWNVHVIEGVSATKSKAQRNFKVEVKGSALRDHRMYEFKASSKQERDDWINCINAWIRETSVGSFVDE